MSQFKPIIFDTGSSLTKVGFSGDETSSLKIFPTVTGQEKVQCVIVGQIRETFIGNAALNRRNNICLKYPIKRGLIADFDCLESLWQYSFFNELQVAPEEHQVLITEIPLNPKEMKEKMIMSLFETFGVQGMCLANQCAMSLFANGKLTGLVLESGDGVTNSVPIYEGYALPHGSFRLELAGQDLTDYLKEILLEREFTFNSSSDMDILRDMKEKTGYVAMNYEEETKSESSVSEILYKLPDGNEISLRRERCKITEILFQPKLIGMQEIGIHEHVFNSIRKCDVDIRKELFNNICLSGGSTMFNGMKERLEKELQEMSSSSMNIRIIAPEERNLSNWIGGNILSQLSTFQSMCVTREEYEEIGVDIVHRRFI